MSYRFRVCTVPVRIEHQCIHIAGSSLQDVPYKSAGTERLRLYERDVKRVHRIRARCHGQRDVVRLRKISAVVVVVPGEVDEHVVEGRGTRGEGRETKCEVRGARKEKTGNSKLEARNLETCLPKL